MAVFQPPSSQSTLSGWSMRSEANFRLSECQPRPGFGSSLASRWALYHQMRTSDRPAHFDGCLGEGSTGASPVPGLFLRASSRTARASAVAGVRCL